MRILIFAGQLNSGGAGRVSSMLISGWIKQGYNVIAAIDTTNGILYPIPDEVQIENFKVVPPPIRIPHISILLSRARLMRRLIKRTNPDVIVAVENETIISAHIARLGLGIPLIGHDHTSFYRDSGWYINLIRYHLYGCADKLVILTERDKKKLDSKYPNKVVIYNPVPFESLEEETVRRKNILCAGRLDIWKIKGFDRIIRIFAQLSNEYKDWVLEFAGTGSESSRKYLESLVQKYGIEDRVKFLGMVKDMKSLYAESSIFALPSRLEGFPMVMMEAMSQGCACVSFDVKGACSEMITDGESGFVVEDDKEDDFYNRLDSLMSNDTLRTSFSRNAKKEIKRFSIENIINDWDCVFKEFVKY